jgi:Flp pilus assembly pilin Flp
MSLLKNLLIEEHGQDMVEYGLVIALLIVGASVGYASFFNQINNALNTLASNIATLF